MKVSDKLQELTSKRRDKLIDYIHTDSKSWKKKLKKLELDQIDIKIKIEKLKLQYE
jgi:hypothetical protein